MSVSVSTAKLNLILLAAANAANLLLLYAFLAIVVIGVGLYALLVPKSYDWSTSPIDLNSEEPFAQKVMHDVLSHSFSHGYRVSDDLDSTLVRPSLLMLWRNTESFSYSVAEPKGTYTPKPKVTSSLTLYAP